MSEEHDSWFKDAFGVDLGQSLNKIKDEASAALGQATSTVSQVVTGVQGAVGGVIDGVTGAAVGVVKKVAGAVSPSGSSSAGSSGGGTGSFPLGGSVGRGGKNAANDVSAVQAALGIAADGQCGPQTIAAIEAFQRTLGQARPDGRVDAGGGTERALAGGAKRAATPSTPAPTVQGDDSGGVLDQLQKSAAGLLSDVKDFGGQVIKDAGGLLDDAKKFGEETLGGAQAAAQGVLGTPGALLSDAKAAGGELDLSGNFHHELPETKFASFPETSRVQGSLKFKSEINAQIVKGGTGGPNKLSVTTNQGLKFERDLAKQKADELSEGTLRDILKALKIKELKETVGTEISAKKIKINVSVTATIGSDSIDWITGTAKAEFALINAEAEKVTKDPSDFVVTGFGIEGGAKGENIIPMDSIGLPGFGLKVQVTGVISGTIAPNFKVIFADAAKDALKKGAKEVSKQLLKTSETAAIDVIVTVGLIFVAIAAVVATGRELAIAGEERQLAGQVGRARNEFTTGFFAAMKGEPNPGAGFPGLGWKAGNDVFQQALTKAEVKNPDAAPDEIRKLALNACATVTKNAEVQPRITHTIGDMFFSSWVKGHHGLLDTASEAKTVCTICFARAVTTVDDPDMKAWNDAKNS